MESFISYAAVLLDLSVNTHFDYGITPSFSPLIQPGTRVEVPVKGFLRKGYVMEIKQTTSYSSVKSIASVLSDSPLITKDLFQLAQWMARYYCSSFQEIFRSFLPPAIRKGMSAKEQLFVMRVKTREETRQLCANLQNPKPMHAAILEAILPVTKGMFLSELLEKSKGTRQAINSLVKQGILQLEKVSVDRSPLIEEEYFKTKRKILNEEQAGALQKIERSLEEGIFHTHLLYGVTGSGKTEVYLQAIEKALQLNKSTIMLVPEISLTSQTIERFRSRFDEKIAILHHRLSHGERNDEWHNIHSGKAKIVIGARSAIFSPVQNVGLIIVDEEHEQSYKQSDSHPCYQARDVAVMRGKFTNSTVILGSATPSIESFYNAQTGKYTLSILQKRAEANALPSIKIIDMRREFDKAKGITQFSEALLNAIEKRMSKGEQTILFLNRRGYHTLLLCQECQYTFKCVQCDVALTFHLGDNCLCCHLCNYQISPPPRECPKCAGQRPLKFRGAGTEQIERALHAIFPSVRTLRIDADTTKHKGSHHKLLRDFGAGKAEVLIGTQMIAKGLHFPEVTLVGVLNADAGLQLPDFRASETVFQLITQVAGRAGRGKTLGEVLIQTSLPENGTIQLASQQDYHGFYEEELKSRELFRYPPFSHLAKIVFSGENEREVVKEGEIFRTELIRVLPGQFDFHPLVPCGHVKVKNIVRYQFLLRGPSMGPLHSALEIVRKRIVISRKIKVFVDVNPSSTFF
jgi:primosomal protein N' (replication factor Y) (superfamily II helicase)